jgi:hypothetical protein
METNTTRRALLKLAGGAGAYGAGATLVSVAGVVGAAYVNPARAATIAPELAKAERLWAYINTTRTRLWSMTDEEDSDCDHPLWDELGTAEAELCAMTYPSPRIAEMQLWLALDHSHTVYRRDASEAIARRDLAALTACKTPLDFNDKLIASALQSLRAAQEA